MGWVFKKQDGHWKGKYLEGMLTIGRDHMMPCVFALFGREVSLFVCLCVLFFCLFVLVRRKRLGKDFVAKHLLLYVAEFFCGLGFPSVGPCEACHCWSNMITMIIWATVTCLPGCLGGGVALIFSIISLLFALNRFCQFDL